MIIVVDPKQGRFGFEILALEGEFSLTANDGRGREDITALHEDAVSFGAAADLNLDRMGSGLDGDVCESLPKNLITSFDLLGFGFNFLFLSVSGG